MRETALLGRDVGANDQREDYLRARLEAREDGELIATPVDHQDSSLLGNLAAARALLIRPPFAPSSPGRLGLRDPAAAALSARNGSHNESCFPLTRN